MTETYIFSMYLQCFQKHSVRWRCENRRAGCLEGCWLPEIQLLSSRAKNILWNIHSFLERWIVTHFVSTFFSIKNLCLYSPWCSTGDILTRKNLDSGWRDAASSLAGRSPPSPRRPWWPRPSRRTRPPSAASHSLPSWPWSPRSPWTLSYFR